MKVYIYAKSGHDIGLDAVRRCSYLAKLLQDNNCDPILCTSDFRASAYAKSHLNINNYISVNSYKELENILNKGDILIYDTIEDKDFFNTKINELCTLIYSIPENIPKTLINLDLYKKQNSLKKDKLFFFSDEDSKERLLDLCQNTEGIEISLLWGYFFSTKNKKSLSSYFKNIIDEDKYIESVINTKHIFSASLNTCLEAIASGNKPVLFKRKDKIYDEALIKKLHLPIIEEKPLYEAIAEFEKIIKYYPKLNSLDRFNIDSIIHDIFVRIDTFRKLTQ